MSQQKMIEKSQHKNSMQY